MPRPLSPAAFALVFATMGAGVAFGAGFEFIAAPQSDLNRVYRVDKATGEVAACQYEGKEGGVGATRCYPPGEGAMPQDPGEYALVASRHEREAGVFRVEVRTGAMSICYVLDERSVCTPQGK